jgi:hypothetical protein
VAHRAAVFLDGFAHVLEHGIEKPPRLFGITIGDQLHRALEVGEQHGHQLALAFELGGRGEDTLDRGGVSAESRERGGDRMRALGAEFRAGGQGSAAGGAVRGCGCCGHYRSLARSREPQAFPFAKFA